MDLHYVQYGCGFSAPQEWLNFDASPTLAFERVPLLGSLYTRNSARFPANVRFGDIRKGLPLQPGSCRGIFASHVLEHLSLKDFHIALENTLKLLAPNGIFRLVVPDLAHAAQEYVRALGDPEASHRFMRGTYLGREERPGGLRGLVFSALRNSEHMWMWDYPALEKALREHGFSSIRRCSFNDSEDPMFAKVEEQNRFQHAVGVESRKPA